VVSKKKVIVNTLARHEEYSRGPSDYNINGEQFVRCECGWEGYTIDYEDVNKAYAEHLYHEVKKALKKRKKIVKLLKE
jgi:hypothetical protein